MRSEPDGDARSPVPANEQRIHALLAHCARPVLTASGLADLAARLPTVSPLTTLLESAEQHALGPLLFRHVQTSGASLPDPLHPQLKGLYLRHRLANAVRLAALGTILDAFERQGIQVWVLKGLALMGSVYPDPALRPLSDLDLLVPATDAVRAQRALHDLGWQAPLPKSPAQFRDHHHLPTAVQMMDGIAVQVEIHHSALGPDYRMPLALDDARERPRLFDLDRRVLQSLGYHEGLWHLCAHLVGPLPRPFRLIWMADVIGYVEAHGAQIDWARVRRQFPVVIHTLEFLDSLAPLPEDVRARPGLGPRSGSTYYEHLGEWSWSAVAGSGRGGVIQQLWRVVHPPAWWMELRYGRRRMPANLWARLRQLVVARRAIVRRVGRILMRRR